jgi:hypothetical protein
MINCLGDAMKLHSNDPRAVAALGFIALAFVAVGFVALFYIKKYGKQVLTGDGMGTFASLLLGGSVLIYIASCIGFIISTGPGGDGLGAHAALLLLEAVKFVLLTFAAVWVQSKAEDAWKGVSTRSAVERSNVSRFSPVVGCLALSATYFTWSLVSAAPIAIANPSLLPQLPQWIITEAISGYYWLYNLIATTLASPLRAVSFLGETFSHHRGNQFAFAKYFSAILLLWAAIEFLFIELRKHKYS